MRGQRFTALRPAENRLGQIFLQRHALRPVADHDQLQRALWISVAQLFKAAFEQTEVFLWREPSYVNHRNIALAQSPLLTQGVQAFGRVEQLAVHTAGQQRQSFEMPPLQFQSLTDTRHQCQRRTVVEPAQIMRQEPRQQAEAVLAGVLLEIGMEATDHRNPQAPRRSQRRQTERAFGGDVQHVRTLVLPAPQQLVHRRLAPLQSGIARQRPAPAQEQAIVFSTLRIVGLTWAYQVDPMSTRAQSIAQAAKGVGHAVDFRWEGFADQSDM